MENIGIKTETIQLDQFLKWAGVIESGGMVKALIADELIYVNGERETARRRKLKAGDVVELKGTGSWKVVNEG